MTDEQYEAAIQHCDGYNRQYYRKWYKAVLSAAPTPEEPAAQRYDHADDALYLIGKELEDE